MCRIWRKPPAQSVFYSALGIGCPNKGNLIESNTPKVHIDLLHKPGTIGCPNKDVSFDVMIKNTLPPPWGCGRPTTGRYLWGFSIRPIAVLTRSLAYPGGLRIRMVTLLISWLSSPPHPSFEPFSSVFFSDRLIGHLELTEKFGLLGFSRKKILVTDPEWLTCTRPWAL